MRFRHTHRPVRRDPDNTTFKFVKNAALVIAGSYFYVMIWFVRRSTLSHEVIKQFHGY